MHDSWENQGFSVQRITGAVSVVEAPSGKRTWLTAEGRTSADRYVIRRVMRHHPLIFQLLEQEAIPTVRSRAISSSTGLRRFVEGRATQVVLMPMKTEWDSNDVQHLTDQEAVEIPALPFRRTWVQARPQGRYLRVLATPHQAWLITETSPRGPLNSTDIEHISRVAVDAVRAVPELQWAAVDLIYRRRRLTENRPDPLLVEGITLTPRYSQDDHTMAGNFDEFSLSIIP